MINSYVREAVLPPVVEKIVKRQVLLEKRHDRDGAPAHADPRDARQRAGPRPALSRSRRCRARPAATCCAGASPRPGQAHVYAAEPSSRPAGRERLESRAGDASTSARSRSSSGLIRGAARDSPRRRGSSRPRCSRCAARRAEVAESAGARERGAELLRAGSGRLAARRGRAGLAPGLRVAQGLLPRRRL